MEHLPTPILMPASFVASSVATDALEPLLQSPHPSLVLAGVEVRFAASLLLVLLSLAAAAAPGGGGVCTELMQHGWAVAQGLLRLGRHVALSSHQPSWGLAATRAVLTLLQRSDARSLYNMFAGASPAPRTAPAAMCNRLCWGDFVSPRRPSAA